MKTFVLLATAAWLISSHPASADARPAAGEPSAPRVLECGAVIDPASGSRLTGIHILVDRGLIQAVGPDIGAPTEAERIDLSDATCLPGLIDLHTHLMIDLKHTITQNFLQSSSADKTLAALANAQTMLRLGFTTLRIPGDLDFHFGTIALRDAIARGEHLGPRMLVAPHLIGPTGGHSDLNELAGDAHQISGSVVAAGADSMREAVRRELKGGADWIKVMATGGVMSQHDDPEVQSLTDDELRALAEEAHRHKIKITAHAHGNAGVVGAAKAGFDSIEHGTMIDASGIEAMLASGTVLVPTAYVIDWIVARGSSGGITEDNLRKALLVQKRRDESLRQAYEAGVPIGFGSDQIFPHEESPREFAALVRVGIAPIDALRAATTVAAELLGLADELGTIAVGKRADIVAVPGDPLEDIRTMEHVFFVMKDGAVVTPPDAPSDRDLDVRAEPPNRG